MAENYTRENYIVVNKTKYYTGTVFIIDFCGKVQEAAFVCSIPKTNRVLCKLSDKRWWINADDFRKRIVASYFCIPVPYNEKDIFFGCSF